MWPFQQSRSGEKYFFLFCFDFATQNESLDMMKLINFFFIHQKTYGAIFKSPDAMTISTIFAREFFLKMWKLGVFILLWSFVILINGKKNNESHSLIPYHLRLNLIACYFPSRSSSITFLDCPLDRSRVLPASLLFSVTIAFCYTEKNIVVSKYASLSLFGTMTRWWFQTANFIVSSFANKRSVISGHDDHRAIPNSCFSARKQTRKSRWS